VLVLGLLIGAVNGYIVTKMRVPSFIVGLGGMLAFRGIVLGITGSSTIAPAPDNLIAIWAGLRPAWRVGVDRWPDLPRHGGHDRAPSRAPRQAGPAAGAVWMDVVKMVAIGAFIFGFVRMLNDANGIPIPVMILLGLLGGVHLRLDADRVRPSHLRGRRQYGSHALSGVNVARVKLVVFAIMGLMCAFAGIITVARPARVHLPPAPAASSMPSPPASSAVPPCAAARARCTAR
jgi:D-xylose transport system permease protein